MKRYTLTQYSTISQDEIQKKVLLIYMKSRKKEKKMEMKNGTESKTKLADISLNISNNHSLSSLYTLIKKNWEARDMAWSL